VKQFLQLAGRLLPLSIEVPFGSGSFDYAHSQRSLWPRRRPRVGKHELGALTEGTEAGQEAWGSVATLSPIRTPARLRGTIGGSEVLVTPELGLVQISSASRKGFQP